MTTNEARALLDTHLPQWAELDHHARKRAVKQGVRGRHRNACVSACVVLEGVEPNKAKPKKSKGEK